MNVRFSIIIPFYNTPKQFFFRMLDSIRNQTYSSYEIIVIDDGSDSSDSSFLDDITDIRLFRQKNKGVSAARNLGIKYSRGNYTVFVDADDVIDCRFLETANTYLKEYDTEIIYGRIAYAEIRGEHLIKLTGKNCRVEDYDSITYSQKQNVKDVFYYANDKIDEVKRCLLDIQPRCDQYVILGSPCGSVYKTELVKSIEFPENIAICEDQVFNRKVLLSAKTCLVVPDLWYYYLQNQFSAMHRERELYSLEKKIPYWDALRKLHKKESYNMIPYLNAVYLDLYCNSVKNISSSADSMTEKLRKIKALYNHPLIKNAVKENIKSGKKSLRVKCWLVKNHGSLALLIAYKVKNQLIHIQRG